MNTEPDATWELVFLSSRLFMPTKTHRSELHHCLCGRYVANAQTPRALSFSHIQDAIQYFVGPGFFTVDLVESFVS